MARCGSSNTIARGCSQRSDRRRRLCVPVTHAHLRPNRRCWLVKRDPVNAGGSEFMAQQFILFPDNHTIPGGIDRNHVQAAARLEMPIPRRWPTV